MLEERDQYHQSKPVEQRVEVERAVASTQTDAPEEPAADADTSDAEADAAETEEPAGNAGEASEGDA